MTTTRAASLTQGHATHPVLERRGESRIRPDLAVLQKVLSRLGEPQRSFPSALVVGTNGKGSTAVMLAAVLAAHGLSVGLYTSPHLVRVEERIQLNGRAIDPSCLARHLARLDEFPHLTYFETVTAAAFLAFAEAGVDCAVLEAGVGGRWDATRVANSSIAGITNVGSDHQRWLGATGAERAREKGHALAAAAFAVIGPGVAAELIPHLAAPAAVPAGELLQLTSGPGEARPKPPECLPGQHQIGNLHLALALAVAAQQAGWMPALHAEAIDDGLRQVRWPGRLSTHRIGDRTVLADGAHNLEAAQALAEHLGQQPGSYSLLFSCLDDKPVEQMAAVLRPVVQAVAVCQLQDDRAMPLERLTNAFPEALVSGSVLDGVAKLPDPVLVAGSLRLVGELLKALHRRRDDGPGQELPVPS